MTPNELEILAICGDWKKLKKSDVVVVDNAKLTVDGGSPGAPDCVAFGTVNGENVLIGFRDIENEDGYITGESPFCYMKT